MSMPARAIQRPDSRASTTSATSQPDGAALPRLDGKPSAASFMNNTAPEAALLQYQAGIASHAAPMYDMSQQRHLHHLAHHHSHAPQFPLQGGYGGPEAQYVQPEVAYSNHVRMGSVPVHSGAEMQDDRRRKGSAVTATNDKELREMLAKNEGRPLRDVAQEVIQKERTPMAEKTKQLFAMLWLRHVCKPAKTSVPRNRVYSQYANRCGTERVIPLNPASFGKLVRVIFPGIQTRRLGVRGESKYHYVDLALEEEPSNPAMVAAWPSNGIHQLDERQRSQSVSTQQIDFNNIPRLQADTAAFPMTDGNFDLSAIDSAAARGPASRGRAFAYPDARGMQPGTAESLTYSHTLRFPANSMPHFAEDEPVNLPAIQPFLPHRTDNDTAEALVALYRTHCTSLIDSIRFCKEKQFFRLYTSFHGTLTVPVQKLFTHPNLAPWIEECDLVMYRTMVRFVSRLTLQAAPVVVINILSNISAHLHGHIAKTFSTQPSHVLEAKLRPATVFAGLLYRLIRVNQSAHAAANLLTIDQNREQMWREWVTMVNPKRIMEGELPECGYEEVYKILTTEMRGLLEPLQSPAFPDDPYGFTAYNFEDNGSFAQFLQTQNAQTGSQAGPSAISADNVLDRWSTFISSLPARFPNAPARTLLHCISSVGTAALRDITIWNGLSYGHWWVLKIFVDEMSLWMAEMGGFLEPAAADMSTGSADAGQQQYSQSPVLRGTNDASHNGSRMSSAGSNGGDADNGYAAPSQHFQQQQQHQTHAHHAFEGQHSLTEAGENMQHPMQHNDTDIDDSGIGMSFVDDDLAMSKFGMAGSHVGGHLGAGISVDAL